MITTYEHTITKEAIALLPVEQYPGRIFVLTTEAEADRAVSYLQKFSMLGIDTETRPSFRKGQSYKVSLLQVSTDDTCFLFRLNHMGFPASISRLFANNEIMKIGLSLRDDFNAMHKRADIQPQNCVDLQNVVGDFGIEDASLQKIYAILFQKKISKGQRLTNWEADILTDSQKRYAALDAWACLQIYKQLNNIG